ncbi:MAG: extracellular solute-binding protein [Ruminococcaceae bacterium]|nr:extracellular solute-binding protein [Oscillospiraceae bacterium]
MYLKRHTAFALAVLMAFPLTACSSGSQTDSPQETTPVETTETVPTETALTAELPDKTYGGEEVMFLTSLNNGYDWYTSYEIYAAEMNGQLINDAVFTRNQQIEELLDIRIAETKMENAHTVAQETLIAGDDQFDVVMPYINNTISLATQGLLMDLNTIPYLDLEKPWWDQRANANMIIADKLFFSTGDIAILDNECTMVMFFNKDMIEQYSLENPYELVKEHKWTIDKVREMASVVTHDLNGDGKMTGDDTWGLSVAGNAPISFYFGAGERIVDRNDEGKLEFQIGSARSYDVLDKVMTLCYDDLMLSDKTASAGFDVVSVMFNAGQVMFVTFALVDINALREAEFEFGILPYPLYDESQQEYNNLISSVLVSSTSVPYNNTNSELTGVTLEAMAYYSTSTLTPAYYDNALKTRYVRDEESGDMLDIIFSTRVYDLGFIFDWGGAGSLVTSIYNAKSTEYVSKWQAIQQKAQAALDEALETFAALQ